jgi:hypothetical protein
MTTKKEEVVIDGEPIVEETITLTTEKQDLLKVVPARDFKNRIGDRWYYFYKGKAQFVSPKVKEILEKDPTKLQKEKRIVNRIRLG